jgi:hypothetical protein
VSDGHRFNRQDRQYGATDASFTGGADSYRAGSQCCDETVATTSSSDDQVTGRSRSSPFAAFGVACSVTCVPTVSDGLDGSTRTEATGVTGATASLHAAITASNIAADIETARKGMRRDMDSPEMREAFVDSRENLISAD